MVIYRTMFNSRILQVYKQYLLDYVWFKKLFPRCYILTEDGYKKDLCTLEEFLRASKYDVEFIDILNTEDVLILKDACYRVTVTIEDRYDKKNKMRSIKRVFITDDIVYGSSSPKRFVIYEGKI